jgi:DNA-binding response OmpR family regulator
VRALLIDSESEHARAMCEYLEANDIRVVQIADGALALASLASESFQIVLLEVSLPGTDGFELCQRVRAAYDVPIVILSARADDTDRIRGLELGADDYLTKPCVARELLLRIRAILRRSLPRVRIAVHTPADEKITLGAIEIDQAARVVTRRGAEVPLTSFEYRILVVLARRVSETVTREELAGEVRESASTHTKRRAYDPSVDRSLDVHIGRLRQKLEEDPKEPRLIKTVRGVGYVLARPA